MASTLYENIGPEPGNHLLSSDTDDTEETLKLKLAEEEPDDGFEEMHVKRSSGELEDKELSVTTFQNGHEHNGINGNYKHDEQEENNEDDWRGRSSENNNDDNDDDDNDDDDNDDDDNDDDDNDDDDNGHDNDDGDEGEYGEQVIDELQTTSAEFTFTDETPVSTPFYGKTYVAPEYMNFQVPEEDVKENNKNVDHDGDSKAKESSDFDARTPDDEKLCDNEPEKIEVENHDTEQGGDDTLSEEASSENEDEGEVQVDELMKDDKLETEEDDKIPRLDQEDGHDNGDEPDAETGKESTLEHSDSLHVNVPLSPTPDSAEVESQGSPDDEDDDLERKFEKENKEIHSSEKPTEKLSMVERDEEEEETCSLKIGKDASAAGMASEDLGETNDQDKEDENETDESDAENESRQSEDYLCENVTHRSIEEERKDGTSQKQLGTDSGIGKDLSESISSELEPEEESAVSDDERIELSPINEDNMEENFDYDNARSYPVHTELQTNDVDSDLSGKVKELGRIFEGGGPVYPKSTPGPEAPDGTPVSVRKFKALFEQDRSSVERAREPVRREELMTPPRGIVKNLRGLFENPEGFQAKKG